MNRKLVIWGCGGHGREVNDLCEQVGWDVLGFLDERPHMKGATVDGLPVLGDITDIASLKGKIQLFCGGVGDPALKRRFLERTLAEGFDVAPALVHPGVRISSRCQVGMGAMVAEGCILTIGIRIGAHVTLNRSVNVGHDATIGDFATLAPGVIVSGHVQIGEGAFLGTGCAIREKLSVGPWSVVGGGAFVAKTVRPRTMVVGVPAVLKREF